MRLDLVLKQTTLIKRRTIAKELCDHGKVSVNGKVSKASSEIKEGDVITISMGQKTTSARISFILKYKKEFPIFEEIK